MKLEDVRDWMRATKFWNTDLAVACVEEAIRERDAPHTTLGDVSAWIEDVYVPLACVNKAVAEAGLETLVDMFNGKAEPEKKASSTESWRAEWKTARREVCALRTELSEGKAEIGGLKAELRDAKAEAAHWELRFERRTCRLARLIRVLKREMGQNDALLGRKQGQNGAPGPPGKVL